MIIKVEISEETWARMLTGKRVEGTLGLGKKDLTSSRVCSHLAKSMQASLCSCLTADFNAFHRKARKLHDKLVKKLPWGWVKESKERFKVYESVPKKLGLEDIVLTLDDEHKAATDAIIDYAIVERA